MKLVIILWVVVMVLVSVALYRLTRFEYQISDGILEIRLLWAGLFSIPKRVRLADVSSVDKLRSFHELVPLINGTFPSLWGKFTPKKMLIISFKHNKLFPLIITPEDPDSLTAHISASIT